MRAYLERQLDLDVYLPGSGKDNRQLEKCFPYHIEGHGRRKPETDGVPEDRAKYLQEEGIRRRHNPSCVEEACAYGNLAHVILLWSQGAFDPRVRRALYEGSDATPLMWASLKGHLPIVRFLVDQGAPVEDTNALGHTALHWAITAGKEDVTRFLLDCGANPAHTDNQGNDAAVAATQNGQPALLMMLCEDAIEAGVVAPDRDGVYRVVRQANNPRTGRAYYHLDPSSRDAEGHSSLHWAAYRNSPTACQYLVEYWGFELDTADMCGRTPLIWAAREGFSEVIEYLLGRGADRHLRDKDGYTAIQYATSRNHPEAQYVLSRFPVPRGVSCGEPLMSSISVEGEAKEEDTSGREANACEPLVARATRDPITEGARHGLYKAIRDRRACGTLALMQEDHLFRFLGLMGVVYIFGVYAFLSVAPPFLLYFPMGAYFFKNVVWTWVAGYPLQGGVDMQRSISDELGIATSIGSSLRGIWRFRLRDPANLFAMLSLIVMQLCAWSSLGLTPLLFTPSHAAFARTPAAPNDDAYDPKEGWLLTEVSGYAGGQLFQFYFRSADDMIQGVLFGLLLSMLVSLTLCKTMSMRAALKKSEEGVLRTSAIWRILKARQYQWLHPRLFVFERHVQLPVRSFYCQERDVVVRGYDGYSSLLDCPVGQNNHLWFVLFITCFTVFEGLLLCWGVHQARVHLRCDVSEPYYANAWTPFGIRRGSPSSPADIFPSAGPPGVTTPVLLHTIAKIFLHGLPCRQREYLIALTHQYERGELSRMGYLFWYYIWPTRGNALGVWVFPISLVLFVSGLVLTIRQWLGVCRGATRMELSNPSAPGHNGQLVKVFPPDVHQASLYPINGDEEKYYEVTRPEKMRSADDIGRASIFADGSCVTNILLFLLGRHGRLWRGAMSVSGTNTPVRDPLLSRI